LTKRTISNSPALPPPAASRLPSPASPDRSGPFRTGRGRRVSL
jgi:hypothetical protein